jgi:DNA-binding beta-propeller fold protein YncE
VSVIDPSTNTVVDNVDVGNGPGGVAVSPTGADAGDIYVVNTNSDTVSVIEP